MRLYMLCGRDGEEGHDYYLIYGPFWNQAIDLTTSSPGDFRIRSCRKYPASF